MLGKHCQTALAALCFTLLFLRAPYVLAQNAPAQTAPSIHITAYGEYVVGRQAGTLDKKFQTNSLAPVELVEDVHFLNQTNQIEARLCRRFGIQFKASNVDPVNPARVTIRVTHPPLVRPDGRSSVTDSYQIAVNDDTPGLAGYSFDNPWEAAPGAWTFAVMSGDTVLAQQQFDVIAAPAGAGSPPCGDPTS